MLNMKSVILASCLLFFTVAIEDELQKQELVEQAKMAHGFECYDEFMDVLKVIIEVDGKLDTDLQSKLEDTYVKTLRRLHELRNKIFNREKKVKSLKKTTQIVAASKLRETIEKKLKIRCNDALTLLKKLLLKSNGDRDEILYLKIQGDVYRILAEIEAGDAKNVAIEESQKAYQDAYDKADKLQPTDHLRLNIAVNFSDFYNSIKIDPELSANIAKKAYEEAEAVNDQDETTKMCIRYLKNGERVAKTKMNKTTP